jgi:heme/copper-type cytochrome/quinol oxidase subunit 2
LSQVIPVTLALLALAAASSKAENSPIQMTASAETFAFTPSKISARVGEPVTIDVSSTEGVHGLMSPELGIEMTLIRPNHPVTVAFTPKKPGTYFVHCANVCGLGHAGMAFTVDVQP